MVTYLKYLVQVLTDLGDDWPAVVGNIHKYRKIWDRLSITMGREGDIPRVSGVFFKVVFQAVLIFGVETWGMNPA